MDWGNVGIVTLQLKTFVTNLGFFELAIAAPSMKAALDAWGMRHDSFKHGFARETDDPKIIAAAMAEPGVVLKRPVGTTGAFSQHAELPTLTNVLSKDSEPPSKSAKRTAKRAKPKKTAPHAKEADRAAIISFEKAKAKRERARQAEEAREDARREKDEGRIERAVARAQTALDAARERHKGVLADIERECDKLDRRTKIEKERWERESGKLEEARERAER